MSVISPVLLLGFSFAKPAHNCFEPLVDLRERPISLDRAVDERAKELIEIVELLLRNFAELVACDVISLDHLQMSPRVRSGFHGPSARGWKSARSHSERVLGDFAQIFLNSQR